MSVPSALAAGPVPVAAVPTHPPALIAVSSTVRIAGLLAAGLTIAVCVIALVVSLTFAADARHWLAYPFAGIPARPAEAAAIFLHNLRALAADRRPAASRPVAPLGEQPSARAAAPGAPACRRGTARGRRRGQRDRGRHEPRRLRLPDGPRAATPRARRAWRLLPGARALPPRTMSTAPDPSRARDLGPVCVRARARSRARDLRKRMRAARLLICTLAVGGGLGASVLLLPRAVRSLHSVANPTLAVPRASAPAGSVRSLREAHLRPVGEGPAHRFSSRARVKPRTRRGVAGHCLCSRSSVSSSVPACC